MVARFDEMQPYRGLACDAFEMPCAVAPGGNGQRHSDNPGVRERLAALLMIRNEEKK
jgi:hypothetical protein